MDKFLEWLEKNKEHYALKDSSYKKVLQNKERLANTNDIKINTQLATYGDAVLKLALCRLLWETESKKWETGIESLSDKKMKYETDKILVEIIAKEYKFLDDVLKYDKNDNKMAQDYNYDGDRHKFIATAVEACLGAIYLENKSIDVVLEIVNVWKKLIDDSDNN